MDNLSPAATTETELSPVAALYNKLFGFEGQMQSQAYPIHKKLHFPDAEINDIYDWLVANHHVPKQASILDAGCGVGFGAQVLAKHTQSDVCGISVSEREINFARLNLPDSLKNKVSFVQQSFDQAQSQHWDCIVAVESLKHSEDLQRSLAALLASLKPGGTLLLVEDILTTSLERPSHINAARKLCSDWHLKALYNQQDYTTLANNHQLQVLDLTPYMRISKMPLIHLKTWLFQCLHLLNRNNALWKIYRGGFLLDAFYAREQMRYQLLKITKNGDTTLALESQHNVNQLQEKKNT